MNYSFEVTQNYMKALRRAWEIKQEKGKTCPWMRVALSRIEE